MMQTEVLQRTSYSLAQALADDPFYRTISDHVGADPAQREHALAQYFLQALQEGYQAGRVDLIDECGDGAAIWTLPDNPQASAAAYAARKQAMPAALGPLGFAAFESIVANMEAHLASQDLAAAWYLSIAGIKPDEQGKGLGAGLLAAGLAAADKHHAASYLETFNARSVPFYQRHGFEIAAAFQEPTTRSEYWLMIRAARH